MLSLIEELGDFLKEVDATLKIDKNNIAQDIRSDLHYRAFILLSSIRLVGTSNRKINESILKLCNNVTVHGKLKNLVRFLENKRGNHIFINKNPSLDFFDIDLSYMNTFKILEVSEFIVRVNKDTIQLSEAGIEIIDNFLNDDDLSGIFSEEINALKVLKGLRVTKRELGL